MITRAYYARPPGCVLGRRRIGIEGTDGSNQRARGEDGNFNPA